MERPLRGLASRGATSAPLEGPPPRPLEAKAISNSLEGRPPGPLDAWTDSTSLETALGRPERQPNHLTGRGAFTCQLLHDMGRGLGGVRRRQLASAIMPHSGRDWRPLSLRSPLCRHSRHVAGLRSSVRTCLTPPPTVPPTPCTFFPCRILGGHGRRPSNNSTALDQGKTCPAVPSTSHLLRHEALRAQQSSPRHILALQDADTP